MAGGLSAAQIKSLNKAESGLARKGFALGDVLKLVVPKKLSSAATLGGAATEAVAVVGLGASDIILSVTQRVKGANSLPLLGWSTQIAGGITLVYSADPGASAIVDVAYLSAT